MKRLILLLTVCFSAVGIMAQRQMQTLGRGVVVVQNGNNLLVSWRKLAQEPENVTYNVYAKATQNGNYTKLNTTPLKVSNYSTATSKLSAGSYVAVSVVYNGVESEMSEPFLYKNQYMRNVYVDIRFNNSPLNNAEYDTKYAWPCDFDGDGEMDYVVDRNPLNGGTHKLEAYLRDGTYLWTVDMGPNESISNGQDDQVVAYDFDCDGKGEVMIQSSDGTRFWDKANNTWGLYVNHSTKADSDNDGIIDYETQGTKNPPRYFSVIDGMTGAEKASVEMHYNNAYNRTNKASLMGDEYNKHVGKFCIVYLDGIHPSVNMEWHTRTSSGAHQYYDEGFGYDFSTGKAGSLKELYLEGCGLGSFHQIRVADVDFDGKDEMIEGGWTMDHTGKVLFNAGIAHGDRFRTSDINPEIPGLETFAIQQTAGDMLGQILYKAENGEAIKKWYLAGVGDVGRGECYDLDASHLGWEMFSTMDGNAIYDANGDATNLTGYFPTEAMWWDGDLGREYVAATDGDGQSAYIAKYGSGRLFEISKTSGWTVSTVYGARAIFWGDVIGDWREEIILRHLDGGACDGITGFSTDYSTSEDRIYCLMEDPHYRGDCTTKGYYQTPNPGFYLGYDMPRPPLPPVMVTDLICKSTDSFTGFDHVSNASYQDGKSILYDLYTAQEITLSTDMKAGTVYLMPVKGQTVKFSGSGSFSGENDIWKSQYGTVSMETPVKTSGTLYLSEGIFESNSSIAGPVELRAKGTLAGSPIVNDEIVFEGALNYEGCRLMPSGKMTFLKPLNLNKRVFIEIENTDDYIFVDGDLVVTGSPIFSIVIPDLLPGKYKLIEYAGNFSGNVNNFSVRGLTGISYNIVDEDKTICLVINEQRQPNDNVVWTANINSIWDYQTTNFAIAESNTEFVAKDKVLFNDEAKSFTVKMNDLMPTSGVTFENTKAYTFTGDGGFSGDGGLTFNGTGKVTLGNVKSDYTGATIINGGNVVVKDLADGGTASSIGAASASASNWKIGKATLTIDNASTATNRGLTLTDTATINVASGTCALKGQIVGKGTFVKTGNGQVNYTYAGTNTYSGGTILKAGTIAMGAWNTTFGAATSKISVQGNSTITIFNNNTTSAIPSFQNQLEILEGKTVTINAGQRCSIKPTLLGGGTLKINFPYVRGDFGPNTSKFEGVIEVTSGEVRLASVLDLQKGTLQLDADNYVYNNSGTHKLGALIGNNPSASITSGIWNIGYLGTESSFAGAINVPMNKYGEGKLTLTGAGSGNFTVFEGILDAENTSAPITSGTIVVQNGGTLMGVGQVGATEIYRGGILSAGKSSITTGTLKMNSTLKVNSGGIIAVKARGTSSSKVDNFAVKGKVTLNNPVFCLTRSAGEWIEDEPLRVFTGEGKISLIGTPTFEPEIPMPGYKWDWSELASSGIIKVVANPDAINSVTVDSAQNMQIYDMMGSKVTNPSKGIYIINGKKTLVK